MSKFQSLRISHCHWLFFPGRHTDFFDFESKHERAITEGVKVSIGPAGYRLRIARERAKFEAEINKESGIPGKVQ